jgi:hypothetical protein
LGHQAQSQSVNRNRPPADANTASADLSLSCPKLLPGGIDFVYSSRLTSAYKRPTKEEDGSKELVISSREPFCIPRLVIFSGESSIGLERLHVNEIRQRDVHVIDKKMT